MNEKKKRILVLENDPQMLLLLATVLTGAGFVVDCHRTGLFILDSEYVLPDLFIIERDLPMIDGIAVSKFLRVQRATRGVPIVLISSKSLKEQASQLGLVEFVRKPLDFAHLLKVVRSHAFSVASKTPAMNG